MQQDVISAASLDVVIDAQPATPSAPVAGTITQPTCATATASFTIASFESTSTYTFTPSGPTVDGNWRSNSSSRSNLHVYRNECSRMYFCSKFRCGNRCTTSDTKCTSSRNDYPTNMCRSNSKLYHSKF